MDAFPAIRGPQRALQGIPGSPPDLARPPAGCRFAARCPQVFDRCHTDIPEIYQVNGVGVRCFLHEQPGRPAAAETRSAP
jgi:peptide/nickel transport system ATP-binding protein